MRASVVIVALCFFWYVVIYMYHKGSKKANAEKAKKKAEN
jgi:cbb3-type cytochrome oxidase subunit 3